VSGNTRSCKIACDSDRGGQRESTDRLKDRYASIVMIGLNGLFPLHLLLLDLDAIDDGIVVELEIGKFRAGTSIVDSLAAIARLVARRGSEVSYVWRGWQFRLVNGRHDGDVTVVGVSICRTIVSRCAVKLSKDV